jgi:hypothetical protein
MRTNEAGAAVANDGVAGAHDDRVARVLPKWLSGAQGLATGD